MTPTATKPALDIWTPERQKEINEATPENPVRLTIEEEAQLREANLTVLQYCIGHGNLRIEVRDGSMADRVLKLVDKGMGNAAIAQETGLSVTNVGRIIERGR